MPFFLGAAGVLGLDASVGIQFLLYGDGAAKVLVVDENRQGHWRRVSGWMRGWIPSFSEGSRSGERDALIPRGNDRHEEGYGAL